MSATLDTERFASYFRRNSGIRGVATMDIEGRAHPVEIVHLARSTPNYLTSALQTVNYIHKNEPAGAILVFLPSVADIEAACAMLRCEPLGLGLKVIPLYSALGKSQQREAFGTYPQRKCIVSSNITEASVTIRDVVYVVDSGLEKQEGWNPRAGMETLQTAPISQASARTKPGVCFRLYTEDVFNNAFLQSTPPGIAKEDLSSLVLRLMGMGFAQVAKFDFVTPPSPESFLRALQDLHDMKFINADGAITFAGRKATQLPTDPIWMNAFEEAQKLGCLSEMIAIAALLSTQNSIFRRPEQQRYAADAAHRRFKHPYKAKDRWCHQAFLNQRVLEEVLEIRDQLFERVETLVGTSKGMAFEDPDYDVKNA
ncbi:hypothetical protein NM208_g11925 [Fusarium decemcellulare]|uniref:Uncharacterized protein n=1 Tax=Fusarium decemcellulare TaxID=57161 RepID=A0ACC1RSG5_9HYPO|nr:hypothetical protein NM208_g11925 [Fusarium decemcellulare]